MFSNNNFQSGAPGQKMNFNCLTFSSPIGVITLFEHNGSISSLQFQSCAQSGDNPTLFFAQTQLIEYFSGTRKTFEVPFCPNGTPFQKKVWEAIQKIPYGQTMTYGALAQVLDTAPRAIGLTCGANPIPIIIPCHRVVGKNNNLTGYSAGRGIETKQQLLLREDHFNN